MSIISVSDLRKSFRRARRPAGFGPALRALVRPHWEDLEAVRGVTFEVAAGESVAFIGPNGAGKTTTIKILTGILHPSSGHAQVLGLVPWKHRRKLVARLGCVFGQRSQLWYHLPVEESFRLLARVFDVEPISARARLDELVALFELDGLLEQPVRKLSLGQRMRCELAASLLHRPPIVFLDEPTIGLDVVARARIRDLLVRLNEQEGVTIFLTSHDAGDIEHVCDRVLLIDEGRVVLDTSVARLKGEHLRDKRIDAAVDEAFVAFELPGVEQLEAEPHRVSLRVDTSVAPVDVVVQELLRRARVRDLTVSDPSLERVIASLHAAPAPAGASATR